MLLIDISLLAQAKEKPINLKPEKPGKRVSVLISGKTQHYYQLTNGNATTIMVEGPGKLRVFTRGSFLKKKGSSLSYKLMYSINGSAQKTVKENGVERSKEALFADTANGVPAELKSFEISLGRGSHAIEITLTDSKIPVYARFSFIKSNSKKKDWVAFSPKNPAEPVDLVTKEEVVNYYRFTAEKPMVVEATGPAELLVLTRIENHYQMKGRINYRIQVKENTNVVNTFQLSSIRSEVTVYKNDQKLVPGKACEFMIKVPKGKHTFTILPLDQDKPNILGRILIPKKNVKLN
jgi:hypothetical protein